MQFFQDISKDVFAGLIGAFIGFVAKTSLDLIVKLQKDRLILKFLGFPKGDIRIIHSALFDENRDSYNYPSCDMISARKVANLLESVGKKEGIDFTVMPESTYLTDDGLVNPEVFKFNLILLGGPSRNKVTREILERSSKLRFRMYQDEAGSNYLYDNFTKNHCVPSKDEDPKGLETIDSVRRDYGLIMSIPMPDAINLDRGVLVLAGIHGPGTVGAATFISSKKNLADISRKRTRDVIQDVVLVEYDRRTESIIEVTKI